MTTYKSKVGLEIVIPLSLMLTVPAILMVVKHSWGGLGIIGLVVLLCIYIFLSTYYQIHGERLLVKCGFLVNQTIDINTISKITRSNNPINSPATSLDRLEIFYGDSHRILISPKDKAGFVKQIQGINPRVGFIE